MSHSLSDWKTQTLIQVRFADVDMMGHVNNAKFLTYLEEGRVAYFRKFPELDFTRGETAEGKSVILASVQCDFRSPAYLEETLIVTLRTREIRRSSFTLEYEIREEKTGRLAATAQTVMVYFDYAGQKSLEIPEELRKRFEEVEGRPFPIP